MLGIALALNKASDAVILEGWPGLEPSAAGPSPSSRAGLAVSAMVSSSEQVMPSWWSPSWPGPVRRHHPDRGTGGLRAAAWFMPSRWGYAMASSTLEMLAILPNRDDALWKHETGQWLTDYGILSAIGLACMVVLRLRRRGRRLFSNSPTWAPVPTTSLGRHPGVIVSAVPRVLLLLVMRQTTRSSSRRRLGRPKTNRSAPAGGMPP